MTNPVEDSRGLKQYRSICSGELHKHLLKKMVLRVLLSHGGKLEHLSMEHQSDYACQTLQHELEPTEHAKLYIQLEQRAQQAA